ncbi:calpain-A-like isoform X3 [Ruditapes philippinarum]|uniref:calpain-A-like isoform X3 n=1 Tax=Ruditapes philippinarum TaxID=129788 RepID=UPI00295C043E|nr:calpain-A-like isoform X3 [Ruditapes philippinarum]
MPFRTTRTVRTTRPDGTVETRTYTDGDDGGSFGGGMMDFGGFRNKFGNMKISFGGGDSGDGGYSYSLGGGGRQTQRGCVSGRSHRKEKKNPFAGLGKQSYEEIVKKCKEEGCLFEDPEFPAEDASIFFSKSPPRPFEWKRPSEICDDPKYVTGGASRFDVQQGELGDCWLLAAVASLTCNSHLLNKIIIPEQDFSGDNYCGVFKFNFWHQGDWIQVVVDDRLPTYYGNLVFMHSTDKNEFWSALLEKAYAKLSGSYECLKGGSTSEAMEDFTGGVTESVDLQKAPTNLLNIMMKAHARGSLMGCSIDADPSQLEAICDNGLVMGHAYSVTSVKLVEIQTPKVSGKIPLVRVRNPWGNESEWNGAWSDKSAEWTYIPDDEKRSLGLTFDDDGEFWMSFQDWQNNFQKLEICNLGPDSLDEEEMSQGKIRWEATAERGEWIPRVNAGGCRNYLETFATNPQYRVVLTDPDDDEDDLCTMLVGLLQKDRRKKRKEGLDMLTIGYVIYKMKEDGSFGSGPLDCRFFKYNASVAKSPSFINMREICGRHKLSPGTYVIIPSTFEPNQQGEFLLRIFTEKAGTSEEMDEGTSLVDNQHRQYDEQYGSSAPGQHDSYTGSDPPPLGFDLMTKSDINHDNPLPDFSIFNQYPSGPYGGPPTSQGYQPDPYNPGQPYAPPGTYNQGYQPMPGGQYDQYASSAGYQPPPPQPNQYNPHPAYNVGYQPNPYGQPSDPYNTNPYQQPSQQLGFGAPPGQYQATPGYNPAGQPYSQPNQPYGWQGGNPSQYNQPPSGHYYPYGQGEAMEHARHSSMLSAEPGQPTAPKRGTSSHSGMRSAHRSPSPVIHTYEQAIEFLTKQWNQEAPPMTEEDQAQGQELRESFKRIAGSDLEVDAYELRDILNSVFTKEFKFDGFGLDVCRSMVAMHDGDLSGKLGFDEFKQLWQDLRKWKAVFKEFDKDNSGLLSTYELRGAFRSSGFKLSNRSLSAIILRFSNKKGEIEFDDFVLCAIRLKTMIASFKAYDQQGQGVAAYDIDTFIQTTMYS